MNYQETIEYLYTRLPMYQRDGPAALKFSLDNITLLMGRLDNPHKKIKTIHVAGTNGKGSSSHMIASILQESGYRTGLYTSPHLKSFTERIRVDGNEITEQAVVNFVDELESIIEEIEPSFFEITFAMAMQYFHQEEVDFAVVEVGLGGRLDSTNIITPEICLITNISLDHTQLLGNNVASIAAEKAGIIKEGIAVVISEYQEEVADVFRRKAEEQGAQISFAAKELYTEQAVDYRFNVIKDNEIRFEGLKLDLKGPYQKMNSLGVLSVIEKLNAKLKLNIGDAEIRNGLAKTILNTKIMGRWQVVGNNPLTILDSGHNQAGVHSIREELATLKFNKLHIVWGMVNDKEIEDILSLLPLSATYYFVNASIPRAKKAEDLKLLANSMGFIGNSFSSVMEGFKAAKASAGMNDLIFIGGSTFVVAEFETL